MVVSSRVGGLVVVRLFGGVEPARKRILARRRACGRKALVALRALCGGERLWLRVWRRIIRICAPRALVILGLVHLLRWCSTRWLIKNKNESPPQPDIVHTLRRRTE